MIAPPSARLLSLSNVENGISVGTRLRTYPEGGIFFCASNFRVGYGAPAVAEIVGFNKLSSLRYWAESSELQFSPRIQ